MKGGLSAGYRWNERQLIAFFDHVGVLSKAGVAGNANVAQATGEAWLVTLELLAKVAHGSDTGVEN